MGSNTLTVGEILEAAIDDTSKKKGEEFIELMKESLVEYFPKGAFMNEESERQLFRIESGHELSTKYLVSVSLEACFKDEASLKILIRFDRTNDELGVSSQSWETIEEKEIQAWSGLPMNELMEMAQVVVAQIHEAMLVDLGVPTDSAFDIAEKMWIIRKEKSE